MQALRDRHQRKDPRQPAVADEVRGFVDERFGYRGEDEHRPANDTAIYGRPLAACCSGASAADRYRLPRMRVWIDLTNSPHVLVMRPVIERLRADGHDVRVTARDFAQTIELCERFGIAHTAIGRHRGERLAAKARRASRRARPRSCAGLAPTRAPRAARLRHRARPRLQRRDRRGRAAAHPERDDVRLRVGDRPAQRQLPPGARGGGARRDPAAAPGSLRRARQAARIRGPQGGVLPGGLRARRRGARASSGSTRRARSWSCARRPRCRCTTASRTTCSRSVLRRLRAAAAEQGIQAVVLPRVAVPARGARGACPASSCPSTRSTRSR